MIGPQKPFDFGRLRASLIRLVLGTGVCGQDELIISVLKHADFQSDGEALSGGVEVAENSVALPPPHESNYVRIHLGQEESHGPS